MKLRQEKLPPLTFFYSIFFFRDITPFFFCCVFAQVGRILETLNSMNFVNVLKMAKQYR
jgi:hypothetical protein